MNRARTNYHVAAEVACISPKIYNNTDKTIEEIEARSILGVIKNNWRQRMVRLFPGDDATKLYMIGTSFDGTVIVVSHEEMGMNEGIALDYWKHGQKIYTRD